jgi:hypothetical protein
MPGRTVSPGRLAIAAELLAQRKPYRVVAKLSGVSRNTVERLAHGLAVKTQPEPGELSRCPTCGGRVFLPCRLCAVRSQRKSTQGR